MTCFISFRYLAVCHPINAPKWRTPLIAKVVALTAWTLSALLMVPIFMYANTLELENKVSFILAAEHKFVPFSITPNFKYNLLKELSEIR